MAGTKKNNISLQNSKKGKNPPSKKKATRNRKTDKTEGSKEAVPENQHLKRSNIARPLYMRIMAVVSSHYADGIIKTLRSLGIDNIYVNQGRAPVLEEKHGVSRLVSGKVSLTSDSVHILKFLVSPGMEDCIMKYIITLAGLERPGHGFIICDRVHLAMRNDMCMNVPIDFPEVKSVLEEQLGPQSNRYIKIYSDLMGIICIVQRGQADNIARTILEAGVSVPVISYGYGMGIRDQLGLLRIAIPAEKEIIRLVTSAYDAETVLKIIGQEGKLDQPGKGFAYIFPVEKGVIDTRVYRGGKAQVANLEQIVAAIDSIKGSMYWRRRPTDKLKSKGKPLSGRDINVFCDEGKSARLIRAVMQQKGMGATSERWKLTSHRALAPGGISPARELSMMFATEEITNQILHILEEEGAETDEYFGMVYHYPVPHAYTYLS